MRKLALMIPALTLLAGPALAADMAVKANPVSYYPAGSGFYYGFNVMGSGGGANGTTVSGVQVLAGDIGLTVGYTGTIGPSFWFVEAMADISKVNGGNQLAGFNLAGTATFEQRLAIGAPLAVVQSLASFFPGLSGVAMPSIPLLPNGVTAGAVNPYVFVGLNERDISAQVMLGAGKAYLVSWEAGFGGITRLSNGMALDTWVKYQAASSGLKLGLGGRDFRTGDFVGVGMAIKL